MIWALDTETSALHPDDGGRAVVLAWAWRTPEGKLRSRAVPTPHATNPEWPRLGVDEWRKIVQGLANRESQLVFHNAKFDLLHLDYILRGQVQPRGERLRPIHEALVENTVWDTMLAQKVISGENSAALKTTAARLWGEAETAEADELEEYFIQKRQKTKPLYAEAPWDLVKRYARKDVKLTLRLFEWQQEYLAGCARPSTRALVARELAFMKVVLAMEQRGVAFDADRARESSELLQPAIQRVASQLPYRPTLPAAKTYYFGSPGEGGLGLQPKSLTKKGAPALSERDVGAMAQEGVPYAAELHRYQALMAMNTKWFVPWPRMMGEDGRVRASFNLTNVRSHRLSVQRFQVQAIPHIRHFVDLELPEGVALPRELFRAKPGYRLWEIDLSQGEVRIATAITGCRAMNEAIQSTDVHGETCKRMFGVTEEAPNWKSRRDMAKRLTFGTIYGAGPQKLADTAYLDTGVRIPVSEMKRMVDDYKRVFPEFFIYARQAERSCERLGYVTLVSGKRRYFNFGAPLWEKAYRAFNAVIQGDLAETMRDVMIKVEREIGGVLLLQIHDSLVVELPRRSPDGTDTEHAQFIRDIMVNTYHRQYGVVFDAEAGLWEDKK